MALLDQLQITGIRNFPSERPRIVRFQSPLTLIVGENGCGKTTVVECIKFAITHELPDGASSGKNFIHDPRIDKKEETAAQIKLQCICPNLEAVCISKKLTLNVNKGKETCTLKDINIARKDPMTGEENSVHFLKNESITEMCNTLGVSEAIVNNVIFCHQENSNWPLDEGKKVKEIFDEIFDATKYNKALDEIKMQRDRLKKSLPQIRESYNAATNYKKEADSKKQNIYNSNRKRDQAQAELTAIDEEMKPLTEQQEKLADKERNFSRIGTQYETKKTERDMVAKNCAELEKSIKNRFRGDRDDLKKELELFRASVEEKKSTLKQHEDSKLEYIREESRVQQQVNAAQTKLGKLERDEETYKKLNDSFKNNLNRLADDLHLDSSAKSQYSLQESDEVISASQKSIDQFLSEISVLERVLSDKESKKQGEIDTLREKRATLESEVKSLNQQITGNKRELNNITTQINEVNQSESMLQLLQAKLNRINSEIEVSNKNLDLNKLKENIESWKNERNDLDDELIAIDADISLLQAQNVTLAELKSIKARKETKAKDIQMLKEKHRSAFELLFESVPEDNFKIALQEKLNTISFEINSLQKDINSKEKSMYTMEADVNNTSKTLRNQQRDLAELRDRMDTVLESKSYEDELDRVTLELKKTQEHVSLMDSTEYMFTRYITKLEEKEPRCPLCKRFFESDDQAYGVVKDLKDKIKTLPKDTKEGKVKLERLSQMQSRLQELKPIYENITKLQEIEIPAARCRLTELEQNLVRSKDELSKLRADLELPKKKEKTALSIQGDISLLDQNIKDLKVLQRDVDRLESKISSHVGGGRNLDEVMKEQKEKRAQVASLRRNIENGQSQINSHNEKLQKLQKEKNEIQSKQLTIQGGAGMLSSLEDRKAELETVESCLQTELEELSQKIAPLETQLNLAKSELDSIKKEHVKKLNTERLRIQEFTKQLEEIRRQDQEIRNYTKQGTLTLLRETRDMLNQLFKKIEEIGLKRSESEKRAAEIKEFIANQSLKEIDLQNNMALLEKKELVDRLNEEVEELKRDIRDLDYKSLKEQRMEIMTKQDALMKKSANIKGRLHEIEANVKAIEKDLQWPHYKEADERFLKIAYKLKLSEIFIRDLTKYHISLEKCVVTYHAQKMKSINNLIRDYWSRIYQGVDISSISIQADMGGGINKRRTYNYRVVQKKNGVEQDMRNRCSAGQRVLACLIIRLALAETFSRNCGIFALDEPTTNLDVKNSVSLSKALALLVEEKSNQKNFQLIVITHDEEFIENLTMIDKAFVVRIIRDRMGLSDVECWDPINPNNTTKEKEDKRNAMQGIKKVKTR